MKKEYRGYPVLSTGEARMVPPDDHYPDCLCLLMLTEQRFYVLEDNYDGSYTEHFSIPRKRIKNMTILSNEKDGVMDNNIFKVVLGVIAFFFGILWIGLIRSIVEMTIYSETGYGIRISDDIWTDALVFSESDDKQKQILSGIITEGFDFEYEKGYNYTFKAKKVWMREPPQDVSSIKYIFIGPLSKKKSITKDSQETIELFVSSKTVKFTPSYPHEYENGEPKIYDALLVTETGTNNYLALKEIEGFNFESDYEYTLSVKKETKAEPYSIRYILLNIKTKQKK